MKKKVREFDFTAFAKAIAETRIKKGLSYIEAGKVVGTSGPNIERIEKVSQEPKISLCLSICENLLLKPITSFIN